jgi:hypothetical protein
MEDWRFNMEIARGTLILNSNVKGGSHLLEAELTSLLYFLDGLWYGTSIGH